MMHRKFTLFILLTVVCIFGIPCTSISQRIIKGVVTRYNKPAAEVRIFIEGLKNSPQDTTNENGEFEIFIPAGVKYLSFTEKDDFHSNQLKLSSKDTSNFISMNLDVIKGVFNWKAETSLSAASSFFSVYQSSGNNNNISTILSRALIHLDWKQGKYTWLTDFNLLYGQSFTSLKIEDQQGIRSVQANAKSGDLLSVTSSFSEQFSKYFHLTALANAQSQFAPGYSDPYAPARGRDLVLISEFLAPVVFNLGVGIDYRPNQYMSVYYSPCGLDLLFVRRPELRQQFGLEEDEATNVTFGSFLNLNYRRQIMKNVVFATKLQLFTNYLKNKENPAFERPGSIDVQLWQNSLNFNFNKYISFSITTTVIYDEDRQFRLLEGDDKLGQNTGATGPRTQYFHNLGLGLNYSFQSKQH
ncbi:MAG: DUF3078 domain-containing protein [Saprospiraceae bacterium]|nr:DUF3078 domain-containing protein [Saprospiraceae bacterium]MBK7524606.1 DUF3078 domain-containing protein [Saprospiraceae bacterium]MBK8373068.1 DUF3078 domain-containing protein [Saprospiraceae bacterium]MBK8852816.1 DUF3078 domain-containing protein [Saprospiraceae bacterium]MBK9042601.1 DUF3078 domain-containing protein [Saprospiraceae bacterium]